MELQLALSTLPSADRKVLILRVLLEYSHAEVGRAIGVSEDAARMRTERALKKLREVVGASAVLSWPIERAPFQVKTVPPMSALPSLRTPWLVGGLLLLGASGLLVSRSNLGTSSAHGLRTPAGSAFALEKPGPDRAMPSDPSLLPMHATVVISEDGHPVFTGETWRTNDVIRWHQPTQQGTFEVEVKGGVLRSMLTGTDPGPSGGAIIIAPPNRRVVETDAFEAALLDLPVYLQSRSPFPVLPVPAKHDAGSTTVQADGRTYTVWFDTKHSGRVSKVDLRFQEHHFLTSVTRWQKVDGLELPSELEQETWYAGKKTWTRQIKITDVQFGANAAKPPALPKPVRGSLVMDEKRSVIYRIDGDWKRISDEQHVGNGDIGNDGIPMPNE
jgi:hypothetical protein